PDARAPPRPAHPPGATRRAECDPGHAARPQGAARGRSGPRGGPRHAMRGPGCLEGCERGPVVISEAAARLGEQFDKMDADKNGVVTADERRAAMTANRAERRAERGGQGQQRRAVRPVQQPASPAPASE
ncbi:MAG: EF-hand domain-containing protein, partial [Brevundimonas sp.]|nr:EF-hand domain-containing protein [Brevundimonas sp.]